MVINMATTVRTKHILAGLMVPLLLNMTMSIPFFMPEDSFIHSVARVGAALRHSYFSQIEETDTNEPFAPLRGLECGFRPVRIPAVHPSGFLFYSVLFLTLGLALLCAKPYPVPNHRRITVFLHNTDGMK
jgi:hypothetical protein